MLGCIAVKPATPQKQTTKLSSSKSPKEESDPRGKKIFSTDDMDAYREALYQRAREAVHRICGQYCVNGMDARPLRAESNFA